MSICKKFFILAFLVQLYNFLTPLPALAYNTCHVAVLPLVNTANCQDEEILAMVQNKVKNKFKFPFYEILPPAAMPATMDQAAAKQLKDKAAMKILAGDLSADIIVGIELVQAQSFTITPSVWRFYDDNDDTYLDTRVLVKCYTYSAKNEQYASFKASQSGLEPMRVDTSLYNAVAQAMDQLMTKLPYKRVPADALSQSSTAKL